MNKITQFIKEVQIEMTKVAWPTSKQLVAYTIVVILLSVLLSVFLGTLDFGFQKLLTKYLIK